MLIEFQTVKKGAGTIRIPRCPSPISQVFHFLKIVFLSHLYNRRGDLARDSVMNCRGLHNRAGWAPPKATFPLRLLHAGSLPVSAVRTRARTVCPSVNQLALLNGSQEAADPVSFSPYFSVYF